MQKVKEEKGITLIAIVITVIVLLILAGTIIAMLSGDNGILNKAADAKKETEATKKEEELRLLKLAALSNENGIIHKEGTGNNMRIAAVLPGLALTGKIGESTISEGLVAVDCNGNEYVWVEVPKSIYTNETYIPSGATAPSSSTDTENIEKILREYSKEYYTGGTGTDEDEWYGFKDLNNNKYVNNGEIKTKTDAEANPAFKLYNKGCGLTYDEYYYLKNKMLKSVYENGGFWIGRYEVGYEEENFRTVDNNATTTQKTVIKQNAYPYNYVTCSQAESLASNLGTNGTTSSLMFGVQWRLVFKFFEENATIFGNSNSARKTKVKSRCGDWSNYSDVSFVINRGKLRNSDTDWQAYTILENNTKLANNQKLLTTGAADRNIVLNIYDFGGNLFEWNLQYNNYSSSTPCTFGGGSFTVKWQGTPARYVIAGNPLREGADIGFRVALY